MPHRNLKRFALMLTLQMLLLTGCASKSESFLTPTDCARVPELAPAAQPPKTPAICLPSCSTNLSNEIENWQRSLMLP